MSETILNSIQTDNGRATEMVSGVTGYTGTFDYLEVTNLSVRNANVNVTTNVVYVDPSTGADTNDGLTLSTPFQTLSRALQFSSNDLEIRVAAGTLNLGADPVLRGGARVKVVGGTPITTITGLTETSTDITTTFGLTVITVSGPALTPNNYGGDKWFLKVTSGNYNGELFSILDNTSNTITIMGKLNTAGTWLDSATLEIVELTTFVNSSGLTTIYGNQWEFQNIHWSLLTVKVKTHADVILRESFIRHGSWLQTGRTLSVLKSQFYAEMESAGLSTNYNDDNFLNATGSGMKIRVVLSYINISGGLTSENLDISIAGGGITLPIDYNNYKITAVECSFYGSILTGRSSILYLQNCRIISSNSRLENCNLIMKGTNLIDFTTGTGGNLLCYNSIVSLDGNLTCTRIGAGNVLGLDFINSSFNTGSTVASTINFSDANAGTFRTLIRSLENSSVNLNNTNVILGDDVDSAYPIFEADRNSKFNWNSGNTFTVGAGVTLTSNLICRA